VERRSVSLEGNMKLKKIDLRKCTKHKDGGYTNHPDISLRKWYLIKYDGRFYAGKFEREWYGLNFDGVFDAGAQFDMPGTNTSQWQAVWEIIR